MWKYENFNITNYKFNLDVSAGFVAMLHDSDEPPSVEIGGIELAPGRKHKLAYRKRTSQFLPAPYTNCTTQINPAMQAVFDQYGGTGYSYSQRVCQMTCSQTFVYVYNASFIHTNGFNKILKNLLL